MFILHGKYAGAGLIWLLLLSLLCFAPASKAVVVCVSTASGLESELYNWADQDGDREIRLVQGTYGLANMAGRIIFDTSLNSNTLKIRGGYIAGTNCSSRSMDPMNTVITGVGVPGGQFIIRGENDIYVEAIAFEHLQGGVEFALDGDSSTKLRMTHCIVRNTNTVYATPGLWLRTTGGASVQADDNLVYGITDSVAGSSFGISAEGTAYVFNNTIANNAHGLGLYSPNSGVIWNVSNNIVWGNGGIDFDSTSSQSAPFLSHNIYRALQGSFTGDGTNKTQDPLFIDAPQQNYRLQNTSPGVNAGASSLPVAYTSTDIARQARIVGSRIDIGAYENQNVDDLNNFTVTTTRDASNAGDSSVNCNPGSVTCTLREAITRANANPAPSKISFGFSNCYSGGVLYSRLLTLTTALPDISSSVTIDGYTQPGTQTNTSPSGFNARLCILLDGAGKVPYGLRTTSTGWLNARGLTFFGFTEEAIKLQGGNAAHSITGNQFGGVPFTSPNADGIYVTGNQGASYIGAFDDIASYNVIIGSTGAGIRIDSTAGGTVVANNLIGLYGDGTITNGNNGGIVIYNSPNNLIMYNHIAGNGSSGLSIAGTNAAQNLVQYNDIGVDTTGQCAGNASHGVNIIFGAHDNTIGALQNGTAGGNVIDCNGGAGVNVAFLAGTGNRILSNGGPNNAGLSIDLDQSGPTANDSLDADTGPNSVQNYPVILNAFHTSSNLWWLEVALDSTPNQTFRLDFSWSPCSTLGTPKRGTLGYPAGRTMVTTNASGHAHAWIKLPPTYYSLSTMSAIATSANGDTSEVGECATVSSDMIFRDDLGG